jgi:hypothetical protein
METKQIKIVSEKKEFIAVEKFQIPDILIGYILSFRVEIIQDFRIRYPSRAAFAMRCNVKK